MMKKIALVNVIVLGVLWALSEVASWYLLEKRLSHRFTEEFLHKIYGDSWREYKTVVEEQSRSVVYIPFTEYMERPVQGRFLVVNRDGRRSNNFREEPLTSGPKAIYVFGGSTTFGYGVKDDETIPAHLEQILHEHGDTDWKVHNFGAASYYSTPERIRFLQLINAGKLPGIAVFVDGLNDFFYSAVPDRSGVSDQIEYNFHPTTSDHLREVVMMLARRSYTFDLAGQLARRFLSSAPHPAGTEAAVTTPVADEIGPAIARLNNNRRMLEAVGAAFGIRTIFVQQPVPTYHYDPAGGTVPMDFFARGIGNHVRSGIAYERMANSHVTEAAGSPRVLWLADLAIKEPMYVDTVHYSSRFNREIARRIFNSLQLTQTPR